MPLDWVCDAGLSLEMKQDLCIRTELTSPNIICDGQVEGDLCVHVVSLK